MIDAFLRPCPTCARHARVSEDACPFCGEPFNESFRGVARPRPPSGRLSRAALFALGTGALGATPLGCASSSSASGGPGVSIPEDGGASGGSDAAGAESSSTEPVDGGNYTVPYGLPAH